MFNPFKKRFFNLALGAGIGQGCMLVTAAILVATQNALAGEFTTAIGISSLLLLLIDWGGQVSQRQFVAGSEENTNLTNFIFARLPPLFFSLVLILTVRHFTDEKFEFITTYLIWSSLGFAFSILNFSGYLDVKSKYAQHGLLSNINHIAMALYALTCISYDVKLDPATSGAINSLGIITTSILVALMTKNAGNNGFYAPNFISIKHLAAQGFIITTGQLPGQIISRSISIVLLQNAGSTVAAQYNLLKSAAGIFTQIVTLARRANYNDIYSNLTKTNDYYKFRPEAQIRSILLGLLFAATSFTALFLLKNSLEITSLSISALLVQNILWLWSSSYFFQMQVYGKNNNQSLHALATCTAAIPFIYLANTKTVAQAILYESLFSFGIFIAFYLIYKQRYQQRKQ